MRSTEERIAALHRRAAQLETSRRNLQTLITETAAVAACIIILLVLSFHLAGSAGSFASDPYPAAMQAGIFTNSRFLGYIVLGIAAFMLGAAFTILCFRMKRQRHEKSQQQS